MSVSVAPQQQEQSFLDPSVLARIGNLELLAKIVVEGFINGLHRSPHLGASTDFAEHRAYMPGDDIRRIDWKLYARSDRHYIKEYEADTNTNFNVILDVSPSMRYGANAETGRVSKLTYRCYLAASLVYFSSMQRDRVALATIDTDIVEYVPPSAKHLQLILHTLDRVEKQGRDAKTAPGKSTLLAPLRKLSETVRRRSLVLLISDLYEDPDAVLDALAHIRGKVAMTSWSFICSTATRSTFRSPTRRTSSTWRRARRCPSSPNISASSTRRWSPSIRARSRNASSRRAPKVCAVPDDDSRSTSGALFAYLLARQRIKRTR